MGTTENPDLTHAWNYFAFHAAQRISVFNFFIVFSGLIVAGLGASLTAPPRLSAFGIGLGLLLLLLSLVFWQLDRRVSFMIKHSEAALAAAEKASLSIASQIVSTEPAAFHAVKKKRRLWTYGTSFRFIFACTALIGLAGSSISGLRLAGLIEWNASQQSAQVPVAPPSGEVRHTQKEAQPRRAPSQ